MDNGTTGGPVDECKMLNALPKFVTDNSDSLPSPRSEENELQTLTNKIRNLEAILFGVKVAMQSVQSAVSGFTSVIYHLGSVAALASRHRLNRLIRT